jgi:hypothetical protein
VEEVMDTYLACNGCTRNTDGEAQVAISLAAQTLRMFTQRIRDERLWEGFLSASQVRSVLEGS